MEFASSTMRTRRTAENRIRGKGHIAKSFMMPNDLGYNRIENKKQTL